MTRRHSLFAVAIAVATVLATTSVRAGTPFVPGTGEFMADCSDNFEDPNWTYSLKLPKSSSEQDERNRAPGGISKNGLWHEGALRGTPDIVKRVPTPPGGIEGSEGALVFATKYSGIPGKVTNKQQQDDLLMKFDRRLGRSIPVSWQPSCTVRVYLPAFENWEQRNGPSFGMRTDCRGRKPDGSTEPYWPGMFWLFQKGNAKKGTPDLAQLTVRAGVRGHDQRSVKATEPGWWTMGMSYSPDGQIHYYASPGVDDLTSDDYITSQFPYGNKCLSLNNFFFNVANWDNGRSWSTSWVIDDPKIFVIPPPGHTVAELHKKKPKSNRNVARNRTTRPSASQR